MFTNISGQNRGYFAYFPPANSIATITSTTYTVSSGSGPTETITDVPFGTSQSAFLGALVKGNPYQNWNTTNLSDPITTDNTLIVTAEDNVTQITYVITTGANPDIALVAADKAELVDASIQGSNPDLSNITLALTNPLPSSGSNGSTITWVSSDPSIVSNNGQTITRPPYGQSNATITFTATITKGTVTDTKVFTLIVLASLNDAKQITLFNFASPSVAGVINQSNHTITVNVPYGTDLTTLAPTISITGSSVSPTSGTTTDFTSSQAYLVTAADSSTQTYTVTVTAVESNQTVPDVNGVATLTESTPQLVVTDPNQAITLTVEDGTVDPSINYGGLTVIPGTVITSSVATIVIPAGTTITGNSIGWDSVLNGPRDTIVNLPQISGYTRTLFVATEFGFTLDMLVFDKGVRIEFPNSSGRRVGYSLADEPLTEITTLCADDTQAVGDALSTATDCKINVSTSLVVWTKHFTKFALFTETLNTSSTTSSTSSSGNSSSSSPSAPSCNNIAPVAPSITSIKFSKRGVVNVNWNQVENASSWTIAYGLNSGEYIYGVSNFGDSNSRSINIGDLKTKKYYIALRANNGCQPGHFSPEWQVTVGLFGITARLTPNSVLNARSSSLNPNTPIITSIKYVSPSVITISWQQINSANSWTITYGLKSKKYIYGLADFGNSTSRSVNIGGLKNGTYYFALKSNSPLPGPFSPEWRVTVYRGGINASVVQ